MEPLNERELLSAWPLQAPIRLEPLRAGTNNLSFLVSASRDRYYLRIYQNTADPSRIEYEHTLLTWLCEQRLPFEVPAPVPARSGGTLVSTPEGGSLAALFHVIEGTHADRADLRHCRACGEALARLDLALGRIEMPPAPPSLAPYGDLSLIHPAVPDPVAMILSLPLAGDQRERMAQIICDLQHRLPGLYQRLPQQIVHGDYGPSNVLMRGDDVSGILDFEFAGPDLRGLDLAMALEQFCWGVRGTPVGGHRMAAMMAGFREHLMLRSDEAQAVPDLMRLYRSVSLIHRAGRWRKGHASERHVLDRAEALLAVDGWLIEHEEELVRLVSGEAYL